MCKIEDEIEDFLANEKKLKFLLSLTFSEHEETVSKINLDPPRKKGVFIDETDVVIKVVKKSKKNGTKLF